MRKDLQHIMGALESGARNVAEQHYTKNNKGNKKFGAKHMGNEHIALPSFLVIDPILEPVDKIVYSVIRLLSPKNTDTSSEASYPTYNDICRYANIKSHATVSRALIILRMTRWLISKQVRVDTGTEANVYITLDHPISFADIMTIDNEYPNFLADKTSHNHERVSHVANAMLMQHENDLVSGKDTDISPHAIEQVLEATDFLNQEEGASYFGSDREVISYLNKSRYKKSLVIEAEPSLNIEETVKISSLNIKEQLPTDLLTDLPTNPSSNTEELENIPSLNIKEGVFTSSLNIKEPCSSSSNLKTTTTKDGSAVFFPNTNIDNKLLRVVQDRFVKQTDQEHYRIARLLMRIPIPDDRFSMLYEISNCMRYGNAAIRRPIAYIGKSISRHAKGEFNFTEFSFCDYSPAKDNFKKPVDPAKSLKKQIREISNEMNLIWADLKSFQERQNRSPNEFNEKIIRDNRKKLAELSLQKEVLEKQVQSVHQHREQG